MISLTLEKITIIKRGLTGEASVKYNDLQINKIAIDLTNSMSPVTFLKFESNSIVSGALIEGLKTTILEFFQDSLEDADDGIYAFNYSIGVDVEQIS